MGLFDDLAVPARFNRLRKYFHGLGMYDLDPDYHYSNLVATEDQLIMAVFCNKYICTKEHAAIRAKYKHLDELTPEDSDEDSDAENLERTIKVFETMVKQRGREIESLQQKLDAEINAKNDLQYKHNMLLNKVRDSDESVLQTTVEDLRKKLDEAELSRKCLQNTIKGERKDVEKTYDQIVKLQARVTDLQNVIDDVEAEKAELEQVRNKLQTEVLTLEELIEEHRCQDSDEDSYEEDAIVRYGTVKLDVPNPPITEDCGESGVYKTVYTGFE